MASFSSGGINLIFVHEFDGIVFTNADPIGLPARIQVPDVVAKYRVRILRLSLDEDNARSEFGGPAGACDSGMARSAYDDVGGFRLGDLIV